MVDGYTKLVRAAMYVAIAVINILQHHTDATPHLKNNRDNQNVVSKIPIFNTACLHGKYVHIAIIVK